MIVDVLVSPRFSWCFDWRIVELLGYECITLMLPSTTDTRTYRILPVWWIVSILCIFWVSLWFAVNSLCKFTYIFFHVCAVSRSSGLDVRRYRFVVKGLFEFTPTIRLYCCPLFVPFFLFELDALFTRITFALLGWVPGYDGLTHPYAIIAFGSYDWIRIIDSNNLSEKYLRKETDFGWEVSDQLLHAIKPLYNLNVCGMNTFDYAT